MFKNCTDFCVVIFLLPGQTYVGLYQSGGWMCVSIPLHHLESTDISRVDVNAQQPIFTVKPQDSSGDLICRVHFSTHPSCVSGTQSTSYSVSNKSKENSC